MWVPSIAPCTYFEINIASTCLRKNVICYFLDHCQFQFLLKGILPIHLYIKYQTFAHFGILVFPPCFHKVFNGSQCVPKFPCVQYIPNSTTHHTLSHTFCPSFYFCKLINRETKKLYTLSTIDNQQFCVKLLIYFTERGLIVSN